jgi:hypothetical protein
MSSSSGWKLGVVGLVVAMVAIPAFAGFSGTDLFLPSIGNRPGALSSNWHTLVWVYNPGAATANITVYFLERDVSNPTPPHAPLVVGPGQTFRSSSIIEDLFGFQKWGALRFVSTSDVVVTCRMYNLPASGNDASTTGQDYAGIPASFAIGAGQSTQLLGASQNTPTTSGMFRYSFGWVETTGNSVNVRVTAYNADGSLAGGPTDYPTDPFESRYYPIDNLIPTVNSTNLRLKVEVTSGSGKIVAVGSGVANTSTDGTTFEMQFPASVLGLSAVAHDGTLTGDGTGGNLLGLANAAVSLGKLSAPGAAAGKILGTDGANLIWQSPAGGFTLPYSGSLSTTDTGISVTNTSSGTAIYGQSASGQAISGVSTSSYGVLGVSASSQGVVGASNSAVGVRGQSESGTGVSGQSTSGEGVYGEGPGNGVHGKTASASHSGVWGEATNGYGVSGSTNGAGTSGVWGSHSANGTGVMGTTGTGWGVYGQSAGGAGVVGKDLATSGNATGTWGEVAATGIYARGAVGYATGASGYTTGAWGQTQAVGSGAPYAKGSGSGGTRGVVGWTTAGTGNSTGVWGQTESASDFSRGVVGIADASNGATNGVYGETHSIVRGSYGVMGQGGIVGVEGETDHGYGLEGISWGLSSVSSPLSIGVAGFNLCSSCPAGSAYAGYFAGAVNITGPLSKPAGSFKIDHPLDPEHKILYHSFVESPDMMNIYNGNVTTDGIGEATVILPAYFSALNRDFRYQLTVIGQFAQAIVAREIENNQFTLKTDKPYVKVSWQVTGIRQDAYANAHRIQVEVDKPQEEQGTYLHPEEAGQPLERGVEWLYHPELMQRLKELREANEAQK